MAAGAKFVCVYMLESGRIRRATLLGNRPRSRGVCRGKDSLTAMKDNLVYRYLPQYES